VLRGFSIMVQGRSRPVGRDDGDERCDGNTVMQCNSGEWTVKKDCEDTGRTCSKVSGDDADCQ